MTFCRKHRDVWFGIMIWEETNLECMFPEFLDGLDVTRVTQFFFDVSAETGLNHLSDLQHQYLSD